MLPTDPTLFLIIFLVIIVSGRFFLSAFGTLAQRLRREIPASLLEAPSPPLYFRLHRRIFKEQSSEALFFSIFCADQLVRILFVLFLAALVLDVNSHFLFASGAYDVLFLAIVVGLVIVGDFLAINWASRAKEHSLYLTALASSPYLFLSLPFSWLAYQILRRTCPDSALKAFREAKISSKNELLSLFSEIDEELLFAEHDKQLLQSVLTFRNRIAREVMVPRIDLFSLPHDTTIREAALLLQKEGYSRVPIYKTTQDHIMGVLMYKDILAKYMDYERSGDIATINAPVERIAKEVIYVPETKRLSHLLQEFRKKQTHIAVVVDEYGGTSGIVTIEDILEEIVGEIADEYDEPGKLYVANGRGKWIVDARMNLLDLEEELNIKIPQEGDYDTVAGYIFSRLGTIPQKGVIIHNDEFELEILKSNDRSVEKVRITPLGRDGSHRRDDREREGDEDESTASGESGAS